ncbi:MAG: hypothetical protein WC264_00330 [Candidatus Paceibacterota bacterium]|jgi:hypothetical protein
MKIFNKKIIILSFIVVAFSLLGYLTVYNKFSSPKEKFDTKSINQNLITKVPSERGSTITNDPLDPNVLTYTSYKLGIQFSYLKDGGFNSSFLLKPNETNDKIVLGHDSVMIFKKLPRETIEQTLRRLLPEQLKNENCSVITVSSYTSKYDSYAIWDKRAPLHQRGIDSRDYVDSDGIYLSNVCNPAMELDFMIEPNFPDTIYYINRSSQDISYWADSAHTNQWWQTIHLIAD